MSDTRSLAHTKWNCKYHVVFAPKYRRQIFYGEKKRAISEILRKLCEWKGVNIIEAECCPDHIHMLLEIPPKMSVSGFMGYMNNLAILNSGIATVNFGAVATMWIQWAKMQQKFVNISVSS